MPEQTAATYAPLFYKGLGQFFGVFFGVIAGTAVTIAAQKWLYRSSEKQQIKNLKFELELNCKKIQEWQEELIRYRNAVNGDSLLDYFGYFKLSSFIGVTVFQLHTAGVIYKYLSHEHIGQLQEVYNNLSLHGENYLNNQIEQRKQALAALKESGQHALWQQYLKPQVVRDIDFWEEKFRSHLNTINNVLPVLK